ncbi:MAG: hypothetical protein M3Y35_05165 [Actinomycetota bacterium]|nr:hypothetical protein [Actinomycetota bacterium]
MASASVDFKTGWSDFWSKITSAAGLTSALQLLKIVGAVLVVVAIVGWIWKKRRGGGGDNKGLVWTLLVGALFAAPDFIIPAILWFVDLIVNAVIKVWPSG